MNNNFEYFYHNDKIIPSNQATVPLSNIEYMYGFGVYETIRVKSGTVYFAKEHAERLLNSAKILEIESDLNQTKLITAFDKLAKKIGDNTYNLKVLLIGGRDSSSYNLYILPLSPMFPNRNWYKNGVKTVSYNYERLFPQAKTLNMLGSYIAYKYAKKQDCYDALLIDKNRNISEGTRANFYLMKDKTIYMPQKEVDLLGVTKMTILKVAQQSGYTLKYQELPFDSIDQYDSAFFSSTGVKILPVSQINDKMFEISDHLKELMKYYNQWLDNSNGRFNDN